MTDKKADKNQDKKNEEKTMIKVTVGSFATDKDGFKIPIEARIVKGGKALNNTKIRFKKGIKTLSTLTTDINGEALYEHVELKEMSGKELLINVSLEGGDAAESEIKISLPTLVNEGKKNIDPETMTMRSYLNNDGSFKIFVRVLKCGGFGVKTPVIIECDGRQYKCITNKEGNGEWSSPGTLEYGEKIEVIGKVSGIKSPAILKIRRPKKREPAKNRLSCRWLFRKNNGRAIVFLTLMVLLWGVCWGIGWGNSVIIKPPKEISAEQMLYNKIVGIEQKIESNGTISEDKKDKGEWQKNVWLFALIWTLFALVYAPFSLREEIMEGVREGIQKISEKRSTRTSDPFYERLAAFTNSYAAARNQNDKSTNQAENSASGKGATPFSRLLASDLISDVLVELVPSLFTSIFRK